MREIDRTLLLLISSINIDPKDVDYHIVTSRWNDYKRCWPDDNRATRYLYEILSKQCIDEYGDDYIIKFGQCMENLSWSFKMKRKENERVNSS